MRNFTRACIFLLTQTFILSAFGQSCPNNLLTNSGSYYGGFEAGSSNISATGGATDYGYGMPRNGNYEIVKLPKNAGGGGYLNLSPHSGNFLMVSHTRTVNNVRIWYKTIAVTPGDTYKFCAWIANIKEEPVNGFTINLQVDGITIASKTAVYGWSEVCGTYKVPANKTSIVISISDPNAHVGPSHFLGLDDICFSKQGSVLRLGNFVWNDRNGTGYKDDGEPAIPGVTINLYKDANEDNLPDGPGSGTIIKTTVSDANGKYLFDNLEEGRYIISIPIPFGYGQSPNTLSGRVSPSGGIVGTSLNPDNDLDNDNNLVRLPGLQNVTGALLFTNAITLKFNTEPTNEGDDNNGNLSFDLAVCGNSKLGDFVWNDTNANGIKEDNETGISGAKIMLTFPEGTTATETTNAGGNYYFSSLGPGTYKVTFTTPAGLVPSPANQGADDTKDSDPVNGSVMVTLVGGLPDVEQNLTIDAGFRAVQAHRFANPKQSLVESTEASVSVFPNPVKNYFIVNIKSPSNEKASLRILDAAGKIVINRTTQLNKGSNNISINNIGHLKPGNYQVQMFIGKQLVTKKIIIN